MAVPYFIIENERRRSYKQRITLESLSDYEVRKHFGVPWWGAREICRILEPRLERQTLRSHAIPAEVAVLCTMSFFRSGNFQYSLGTIGGIAQSSISRILEQSTNALCQLSEEYISFPRDLATVNKMKQDFHRVAGFPNVLGLADGTHISILAPHENEHLYVNRKSYHSINVQVITAPNHTFLDVVPKYPGASHDSFIWASSGFRDRLRYGHFGQGHLLGDSGYPQEPWLMTPFRNPQEDAQIAYNNAHSKTRSSVERTIGIWKSRFRSMDLSGGRLCYAPGKVCKLVMASTVLHNIILKLGINLEEDDEQFLRQNEENNWDDVFNGNVVAEGQDARSRILQLFM